jgi:opacity protein-like surface antigen
MKTKLLAACAVLTVVMVASAMASAAITPTLYLYDVGTNTGIMITDNGAGDSSPVTGAIVFNGTFGNFILNVDTGQVSPPLPKGSQDLSFVATNNTGINDTLEILFIGQGYQGGNVSYHTTLGGTLPATGGTVKYVGSYDNGNTNCAGSQPNIGNCPVTANLFNTGNLSTSPFTFTNSGSFNAATPFSLLQFVAITESNGTTTGDALITIPEPASMALLGFGLIGFAGVLRRRLIK